MPNTTEETCCICLQEYTAAQEAFSLACGHSVHADCMLRLCLARNGGISRCPYCRAPLFTTDGDDDALSDSTVSTTQDEEDEMEPQWMRVSWREGGSQRHVQEKIAKLLLDRGRNRRAPGVLRRCSEKHKQLINHLARLRSDFQKLKSRRHGGTLEGALGLLRARELEIRRAKEKLYTHKRHTLRRCQTSPTVIDYFESHPLAEVPYSV
jgi:hypothetical protein